MRSYSMWIPMVDGMIFSCQPDISSFFPQRSPFMKASLAEENCVPAEVLYVEVYSRKAYYVMIEFKRIPPDGCFKPNPSIRDGTGPQPRFIHLKVSGSDVTNLLVSPECMSITKAGKKSILCRKLPVSRKNQNFLILKKFFFRESACDCTEYSRKEGPSDRRTGITRGNCHRG